VAVFLAQIGDVRAGCLEDPQSEQAEHGHQGEIVTDRRLAGRGQHGLELQVRESQRWRFRRHGRAADVLSRRVLQHAVDHRGAVEPRRHREPPGHRRRLEPADFLHPLDVQLQMHSPRGEGIESPLGTPRQETAQIRVRVITGGTRESGQISSHRQAKRIGSSHEVSRSGKAGIGRSLHD